MVSHVTKRPRRKPALPLRDPEEFFDNAVAARESGAGGRDAAAVSLPPAAAEARDLAVHAARLAPLDDGSRARVLAELNAALGEDSRARVRAYLDVPLGVDLDRERAAALDTALDTARRTDGAWPDETRQEYAEPSETGWVIPVPRSMDRTEALELTSCVVGLAPLTAAARTRVLAYLNALFAPAG